MQKRRFATGAECKQLLEDVVEKRLPISITMKHEGDWQIYKSNFLGYHGNRLVLALPAPYLNEYTLEPAPGTEIAVTFKKGYNKCLFLTRIIGPQKYELEPEILVPAMSVYAPEQVEKIKRRAYNRTEPPAGEKIPVTFWLQSNPGQKSQGILGNISCGGIGLIMPKEAVPALEENSLCGLSFRPLSQQEPLELEVRYRHTSGYEEGPNALVGFQIVGLELTEEGRAKLRQLSRIVSVYERQKPLSYHGIGR